MKVWWDFLYMVGVNVVYVEELYEIYLEDL